MRKKYYSTFGVIAWALANSISSAQSTNASLWQDVPRLCGALRSEGLQTRAWKDTGDSNFQCITSYVDIGTPGPLGLATNIAYYVTGTSRLKVSKLAIVVNVNNKSTKLQATKRLESAAAKLFASLGTTMPTSLEQAIRTEKPFVIKQAYGQVEFEVERGRVDTLKLLISAR